MKISLVDKIFDVYMTKRGRTLILSGFFLLFL
nr:MAG TPA: hypothetical protein [Caudoviricetes sp.]